jgi:isoquinoline 1-oxidoreductase alpha subunit
MATTLTINGQERSFEVPPEMPLLWVLRDILGLTGTKFGCGIAQCGACTLHVDGKPVRSCVLPIGKLQGRTITTIEAVGAMPAGASVQKAWLDLEVVQCGYCQSGQIMSAAALLASTRHGGQHLPLRPHDDRQDQPRNGSQIRKLNIPVAQVRIRRTHSRDLEP